MSDLEVLDVTKKQHMSQYFQIGELNQILFIFHFHWLAYKIIIFHFHWLAYKIIIFHFHWLAYKIIIFHFHWLAYKIILINVPLINHAVQYRTIMYYPVLHGWCYISEDGFTSILQMGRRGLEESNIILSPPGLLLLITYNTRVEEDNDEDVVVVQSMGA
ncbi:hypothetical protein ACJX0J_021111, partial [Zea mays]